MLQERRFTRRTACTCALHPPPPPSAPQFLHLFLKSAHSPPHHSIRHTLSRIWLAQMDRGSGVAGMSQSVPLHSRSQQSNSLRQQTDSDGDGRVRMRRDACDTQSKTIIVTAACRRQTSPMPSVTAFATVRASRQCAASTTCREQSWLLREVNVHVGSAVTVRMRVYSHRRTHARNCKLAPSYCHVLRESRHQYISSSCNCKSTNARAQTQQASCPRAQLIEFCKIFCCSAHPRYLSKLMPAALRKRFYAGVL